MLSKEFLQNLSAAFKYADIIRIMLFGNDYQVDGMYISDYYVVIKTYDYSAVEDANKTDELNFPLEYLTLSLAEIQTKEKENEGYSEKQKLEYEERRRQRRIQELKNSITSSHSTIERCSTELKELMGIELQTTQSNL